MKKETLRKIYKEKRAELTSQQIQEYQNNIFNQLFKFDFSAIENIHVFLPIKRQKEVNTYPIIDFFRTKNKKITISKSNFETSTLQHFIFDENTIIKTNSWGIPEPVNAVEVDVKEIDLVLVPLLISDEKKYRVGYGKGFYDRFLSECKPEINTIGLNFFPPIKKIEDVNEFDVALNFLIYPK